MAEKKARKPRTPRAPKDETAAQKFMRLAEQRLNAAVKQINSIGKLSTANYESTPKQVAFIKQALADAVEAMGSRFEGKKPVAASLKLPT